MKRILIVTIAIAALMFAATACSSGGSAKSAIKQYFPSNYTKAVAVAQCESGLNPKAVSPGGGNWGLFQINRVHERTLNSMGYSWSQITDPFVNSKLAKVIYNQSGWGAWACA